MGRRKSKEKLGLCALAAFVSLAVVSCLMVYRCFSLVFYPSNPVAVTITKIPTTRYEQREDCCRGIEHLELWGDAVNRGWEFKVNSTENCCKACKEMCKDDDDGPCFCHSWVYCGDRDACGVRFGECWLKIQKNILEPERRNSGNHVMWTSGLMFPKKEGLVKLKTEYGVFHIKLLPDCAPNSISYILELLSYRLCTHCKFYRAESRGNSWDSEGNHIDNTPFGPPSGLIQGTLRTDNVMFKNISSEGCHRIRRGAVAWVGSGPEFFISLAEHDEWRKVYTVFGHVVPEDMEVVEKIAGLPTMPEVWRNVSVSVLERPVPFKIRKMKRS